MSKVFQALILNLIIPLAGYFLMLIIMNDQLEGLDLESVLDYCRDDSNDVSGCGEFLRVYYVHLASLISGIISISLVILLIISSVISKNNRKLIALIFPLLIPFTIFITAIQVLIQGIIFTYGIYVLESYYLGMVHFILIGGAGLAAGAAALNILSSMTDVNTAAKVSVIGKEIEKDNSLWNLVNSIAKKVNANQPNNIVVGLEPGFYITAAKLTILNEKKTITGETLYLSLPLIRLYSQEELSAIIGHELAHFKGEDTQYSLKFYPVYRGLQSALDNTSQSQSIVSAPGLIFLNSILSLFSSSVAKISRERELTADQLGIQAGGKDGLAYSLLKLVIFEQSWNTVLKDAIDECNQGKFIRNLSKAFMNNTKFDLLNASIEKTLEDIGNVSTPHPTDSHPPIIERLKQCEIILTDISIDKLNNHGNAKDYIDNLEAIEEDLTYLEHLKLVALGYVKQPSDENSNEENSEQDEKNFMLNAIYNIASAMIYADGKIEKEEVQVAETIGKQLIPEFNSSSFREFMNEEPKNDLFEKLVSYFAFINIDSKNMIYGYLEAIANADGDLAEEEKKLLELVSKKWELKKNL